MTRAIPNLIRLHAWRVDEHRRAVAEVSRRIEDASAALTALKEAFLVEQETLRSAVDRHAFGFGAYAERVRTQQERLRNVIAQAEDDLAVARQQLAGCYRERRKFELLKAHLDRAAAAEAAKREQVQLDETAASMRRSTNIP